MDKMLKEMKDDFENYLNEDKVFTEQEKRRIINQVRYSRAENKRQMFFPKVISSVTLISLCALIFFLVLNFTDAGEKSQPADLHKEKTLVKKDPVEKEDPVKTLPKYSDKEIADKVNFLQSRIVMGMAEKEVVALLGNDYVEINNSDSESGSVKQIGYNFLVNDSAYQLNISHEIAVESIHNRKIGVQLYIGFSDQSEVLWTSINFAEGDSVIMMSEGMNGRTTEKIYPETNDDVIRFTLTPEEEVIYQKFLQDLDEKHLKDVNPISIAKLYVQAQLDRRYDAKYALYTDREGFVQWTKEEDEKIPERDRGTILQTLTTFNNIGAGSFIPDGEYDGYIEYEASKDADAKSGFKMIKDEDGIWNVAFMPIQ
ncbi:hypothetical protein ACFW35_16445 [Fictibacillus sp. NPDC058756]|uniref:hypothetical protein n=1 Tax=Fictibacillus sp. NPDC058756 TaxID=3346625 RepID=UPI00369C591A